MGPAMRQTAKSTDWPNPIASAATPPLGRTLYHKTKLWIILSAQSSAVSVGGGLLTSRSCSGTSLAALPQHVLALGPAVQCPQPKDAKPSWIGAGVYHCRPPRTPRCCSTPPDLLAPRPRVACACPSSCSARPTHDQGPLPTTQSWWCPETHSHVVVMRKFVVFNSECLPKWVDGRFVIRYWRYRRTRAHFTA